MNFVCARAHELPTPLYQSLAEYRYEVFVQRLGWELPGEPGCEQDEFDQPDTVHLVARDDDERIVGCGRLLPTTGPYLLESVFPQLLNGLPVPRNPQVWELSRFAAMPTQPGATASRRDFAAERVLLQALRFCAGQDVTHLLAVSTPPVERLLLRAGVECQRLGPPEMFNGQPVLAFVIAVNANSIAALEAFERAAVEQAAVERGATRRQPGAELQVLQNLVSLSHVRLLDGAPETLPACAAVAPFTPPTLH